MKEDLGMELRDLVSILRDRLAKYRMAHIKKEVSCHINAIEISLCLTEYFLYIGRPIGQEEENWFKASYYVQLILENSEWEDISTLYMNLTDHSKQENYFRK